MTLLPITLKCCFEIVFLKNICRLHIFLVSLQRDLSSGELAPLLVTKNGQFFCPFDFICRIEYRYLNQTNSLSSFISFIKCIVPSQMLITFNFVDFFHFYLAFFLKMPKFAKCELCIAAMMHIPTSML